MTLLQSIKNYNPTNEQEARDKEQMLRFMAQNIDYLERENQLAHFTASIWTVNKERTKSLMVYHNIYNSWSWIGGHADGCEDLCAVATGGNRYQSCNIGKQGDFQPGDFDGRWTYEKGYLCARPFAF